MPKPTADLALMTELRDAYARNDTRAINRFIAAIAKHVDKTLGYATRTYPDADSAKNAALYDMVSEHGVNRWLNEWDAGLKAYAANIGRSREARDAALLTRKIVATDAAYSSRSTSLDAHIEAHGDRFAGAKTLDQLDAERRREVRTVREGFERAATGTLTDKQTAAVLRYANLHTNNTPEQMATRTEAAAALLIDRHALRMRLERVTRTVEQDAAFRLSVGLLVDAVDRVDREAAESQLARARKALSTAVSA